MPAKALSKPVGASGRRKDTRTYVDRKAARLARLVREEAKEKEWWDRIERILTPSLVGRVAAAAVGGIALYPQSWSTGADDLLATKPHYGPPIPGGGYAECVADCSARGQREGWSADKILQCIEDCQETTRPLLGVDQLWRISYLVDCTFHGFMPTFGGDIPVVQGLNPRQFTRLNLTRQAWGFQATDDPNPNAGRDKAFKQMQAADRRDLTAMGVGMGLAAPEIANLIQASLSGLGTVLRGIGEIVPG